MSDTFFHFTFLAFCVENFSGLLIVFISLTNISPCNYRMECVINPLKEFSRKRKSELLLKYLENLKVDNDTQVKGSV